MKQKDKLALEYSETVDQGWNARSEAKKAYLAGFETAKKLILKSDYLAVWTEALVRNLGDLDEV